MPVLVGVAAAALASSTATVMDARPGHCSRRGTGGKGREGDTGERERERALGGGWGGGVGRREGANARARLALVALGRGGGRIEAREGGLWKVVFVVLWCL